MENNGLNNVVGEILTPIAPIKTNRFTNFVGSHPFGGALLLTAGMTIVSIATMALVDLGVAVVKTTAKTIKENKAAKRAAKAKIVKLETITAENAE